MSKAWIRNEPTRQQSQVPPARPASEENSADVDLIYDRLSGPGGDSGHSSGENGQPSSSSETRLPTSHEDKASLQGPCPNFNSNNAQGGQPPSLLHGVQQSPSSENHSADVDLIYDRLSHSSGKNGQPSSSSETLFSTSRQDKASLQGPYLNLNSNFAQGGQPPSLLHGVQQPLLEEDDMERTVRLAIEKVKDGSFDEFRARKFTTEIKPLISADPKSDSNSQERFSHLICARLHKSFVMERCTQVLHGLRFFYTALILTGDNAIWIPGEGEILMLEDHHRVESFFWRTIFDNTQFTAFRYQAVLNLLSELQNAVKECYTQNPCVCYHLAGKVHTAYWKMRLGPKVFCEKSKDLVLVMAKCAVAKGRYDLAEKKALEAAEVYFKYENAEAWELWSECCYKKGNIKHAVRGAELAVNCSRGRDKHRLQHHLSRLRHDVSQPRISSSDIDPEWLGNEYNNVQSQQEKAKKKLEQYSRKKTKYKSKAVPKSRGNREVVDRDASDRSERWSRATPIEDVEVQLHVTQQPAAHLLPKRKPNEEVSIEVDRWEDNEESKEESTYSETETDSEPNFDEDEELNHYDYENDKPTKTWFEESRDRQRNGKEEDKLIVGEGLDIEYYPKSRQNRGTPRYETFKQIHVLEQLLKAEPLRYKRCRIELDGPHKAFCSVLEPGDTTHVVEIHGRGKCGQTFNNDEVVVEIIGQGKDTKDGTDKVFGKVIGVLNSTFGEIKYPLLACTNNPKEVDVMHPMCKSVPKIYIWKGESMKNKRNHKYCIDVYKIGSNRKLQFDRYFEILPKERGQYVFLVVLLSWNPYSAYPRGAVLKVLDCGNSFGSGLQVLLNQYRVPTYYSEATVSNVENLLERQDEPSNKHYSDLSEQIVFTIDPPQSRDLDDALSIWKEGDNFQIGVHIADVASVVKKGSAVDKEALKRATSFYPASDWRTHNMLPEPLSQNELSLLPNEERRVISVFFVMNRNGDTTEEPVIKKCIIRSCRQFSYHEVQLIIEGKNDEVECSQVLKDNICQLHHLADLIRVKRLKNSRFVVKLEDPRFPEYTNNLEDEEAHALVEEFMIKANHFIASRLIKEYRSCVPLRCQAPPTQEELDQWIQEEGQTVDMLIQLQDKIIQNREIKATKYCRNNNTQRTAYIPVHKNVWKQILNAAQRGDGDALRNLLCCDELHPYQCLAANHWLGILQSAVYRCSAEGTGEDTMHFMLEIEPYTHFTSPIRRYVDIIVHRLVHAVLDEKQAPYTSEEIQEICMHATEATRRQRQFERGCRSIKQADKLLRTPMIFDAVVDTVTDSGATLCVPSLQNLSLRSRVAQFNLMDFCCKPLEKENPVTHRNEVVGSWNKRIYRYDDFEIRKDRDDRGSYQGQRDPVEVSIDSNMHTVLIRLSDFAKLLKSVLEKSGDIRETARGLSTQRMPNYLGDNTGVTRITSEVAGDSQINHHCKFNLTFSHGQVLRVQMHATADQGVLSPYVQLFQVCDNLSLCLHHVNDPVGTYAKYVTTSIRNRSFSKVTEYQQTWLPIVEMETAVSSVSSEETLLVHDIKIQLHQKGNVILGSFSLDTLFCDARRIEIDGKTIERLDKMKPGESPYDKSHGRRSLDYLCIRYTPPGFQQGDSIFQQASIWIGHAVIKKVKKRVVPEFDDNIDQVVVTFQLTASSLPPPKFLFTKEFTSLVEIIFKTEVDRRTEQMLTLMEDSDDLAPRIALNSGIPCLVGRRLQKCQESPTDIQPGELSGSGYMPANNQNQTAAIRKALVERFSLIQGPPGTGKTYTGLKLVYLFNKINKAMNSDGYDTEQKQVIFCGPSNKSVDLVAKYLMLKLGDHCPRIVRMYGKTIENRDFPVPKRDIISNRSMRGLQSDPELKAITLHYVIRQKGKPHAEEINALDAQFQMYFRNRTQMKIDLETIKGYTRLVAKAQQEELKICDVILCTCAVAGNQKLTEATRISQCIIDESAMCPEPQSMIPIIATKPDQVVLIGDHKQLRPIVQCTQAAELGLDQSLFERYKDDAKFLNIQYRMHPKICEFPSQTFYENLLETGPSRHEDAKWYIPPRKELCIWPKKDNPKVFCHVEGVEETLTVSTEEGNEKSKSNKAEVDKIVETVLYLSRTCKVPLKSINLMTQYNAQRNAIRKKLNDFGIFESITTQTVVASQGGEWDYVIFSTVRSLPDYKIERNATPGWLKHNLGFITDQNQINVALTRARKGLIIIGNANLLNCDPVWRKLLKLYKEEGCYVTGNMFPPLPPDRGRRNFHRPLAPGRPGVLPHPV